MAPSFFLQELKKHHQVATKVDRWQILFYDQLNLQFLQTQNTSTGLIFIETTWKPQQRPYHKQKLAFILGNMRHFALECARQGYAVKYYFGVQDYATMIENIHKELKVPLQVCEPAEFETRHQLQRLPNSIINLGGHSGWLSTQEDFLVSTKNKWPVKMDSFYRYMRKKTGILMSEGRPIGGKMSFDVDNRLKWKGTPTLPQLPKIRHDQITKEVMVQVNKLFEHHPGEICPELLVVTQKDADRVWQWFLENGLPYFGPYQDAMSKHSSSLFHSRLSGLLHLHRLWPRTVVSEVEKQDIELASKEGFIRQVMGWREYVFHIHKLTDGFRKGVADIRSDFSTSVTDGGYGRWSGHKQWEALAPQGLPPSQVNYFGVSEPLFPTFWKSSSGMTCLDQCVDSVWKEAYGHHISRLMVISNLATLLGIHPREITDWFWVAYHDAFDWVVEPNVLGMGMHATGPIMTTKPYVAGSSYINKMSDYCSDCQFSPKTSCPIKRLYWAWFEKNQELLSANPRVKMPLVQIKKRSEEQKDKDKRMFDYVTRTLRQGETLKIQDLQDQGLDA